MPNWASLVILITQHQRTPVPQPRRIGIFSLTHPIWDRSHPCKACRTWGHRAITWLWDHTYGITDCPQIAPDPQSCSSDTPPVTLPRIVSMLQEQQ